MMDIRRAMVEDAELLARLNLPDGDRLLDYLASHPATARGTSLVGRGTIPSGAIFGAGLWALTVAPAILEAALAKGPVLVDGFQLAHGPPYDEDEYMMSVEEASLAFEYLETRLAFFGHTHIPRPENYPVMPMAYISFLLKPNGFFAMNPSNDLPPPAKKAVGKGLSLMDGDKGSCCH